MVNVLAALLADANLLVTFVSMAYAGSLTALGADQHYVGLVDAAFLGDAAALFALLAGLYVGSYHVYVLYDYALVLRHGGQDFALLALVLTGDDHYGIALLDVKLIHSSVLHD